MYVGVDIGGTKTLVAVLNEEGIITERQKFPTPPNYEDFLKQLSDTVDAFTTQEFMAAGVGMPVTSFDRAQGIGRTFGNLPWRNVPVAHDLEQLLHCPVIVENDAKMACLSEAMLLKDHRKVLYVTISTGIGFALTVNQTIDTNIGDTGGRLMLLEHQGKLVPWESFASGRAIVERYGKKASEIDDDDIWRRICYDLSLGLIELIAIAEPDIVVIGGSVGAYFQRYGKLLTGALARYETPLHTMPPIVQAQRPEEAVVYGCYDLARSTYARSR